jgi:regulator of sigma E protease
MQEIALSFGSIIGFGNNLLIFIVALAALIFVHELGHFLMARKAGVVVEKFSLGFGPKIWSYTSGDTEYILASIPLGGYVKMKGEDPAEELAETDKVGSFSAAPVKSRLAIAFMGPLFNIIFAIAIYIVFYMIGTQTAGTTVGVVRTESPALAAGLKSGDKIIEVDGQKIRFWSELLEIVHAAPGKKMDFLVERDETTLLNFNIAPVSEEITDLFGRKKKVGLIGITPLVRNIATVQKGSAAEKAGIKVGDKLISVDDTPIRGWSDLKPSAMDKPGIELAFKISRDGVEQVVKLTPEAKTVKDENGKDTVVGLLGIGMDGEMVTERYGPFGAIKRGLVETWQMTYFIMISIKEMIFGAVPAESIGGPILIFQIYEQQAERGFNEIIRLTALISINLGLLNLLPIPILDGGHILFFLIEILKGKPLSERFRERAQQVGLFMLLSLMVFAFYNDIVRIIG